jgi:hypothetical protein
MRRRCKHAPTASPDGPAPITRTSVSSTDQAPRLLGRNLLKTSGILILALMHPSPRAAG